MFKIFAALAETMHIAIGKRDDASVSIAWSAGLAVVNIFALILIMAYLAGPFEALSALELPKYGAPLLVAAYFPMYFLVLRNYHAASLWIGKIGVTQNTALLVTGAYLLLTVLLLYAALTCIAP